MENDNAIVTRLCAEIARSGPGGRIPSVRQLQRELRASPVTIQRAVADLVRRGALVTRPGDGTFVSEATPARLGADSSTSGRGADTSWQASVLGRAPSAPGGIDHLASLATGAEIVLDNGFPEPSLQPVELLRRATVVASRRASAWDRCLPEGLTGLRALVAHELGPSFDASDVLITPGAQAALDSIFRTFLRPGDPVLIEEPGYPGAIAAALFAGLVPSPVPTDADGVRIDELERCLERTGARLIVLQPRHANPTGANLSRERRGDALALARQFGAFIVEDDWVRDLDLEPERPSSAPLVTEDSDGHVVYLRSFSKASAPGVRVAAVVARGPAWSRLRNARLLADFFAAPLLQEVMIEVLSSGAWPRHLKALRAELRLRRDALHGALTEVAPSIEITRPTGGVVLWGRLPHFVDGCRSRGVRVGAGRPFWSAEPPSGFVRLSFAGADADSLISSAERIGHELRSTLPTPTTRPTRRRARVG